MARLQGVPHGDQRRFRTGAMCLDLAHTGGESEAAARWELLHAPADLGRWLVVIVDPDGVDVVDATVGDLEVARGLREAIWSCAQRAIAGRAPTAADRRTINEVASGAGLVPQLAESGTTIRRPVDAATLLVEIARDAVALFGSDDARRVRECASDTCGLLFVDRSRPGQRKWCSMQRCGTIAKVRTHRSKGR